MFASLHEFPLQSYGSQFTTSSQGNMLCGAKHERRDPFSAVDTGEPVMSVKNIIHVAFESVYRVGNNVPWVDALR